MKVRCEHNCHLCKKEWLGRCMGKHYGKDVSIGRDSKIFECSDLPICDQYVYGGTEEHLNEILYAIGKGVYEVELDELQEVGLRVK